MRKVFIFLTIIFFVIQEVNAQEKFIQKIQPDHLKIQFAGNFGVLSAGLGYSFCNNIIQTDLFYGFVPKSIGGNNINIIAEKNTFRLYKQPLPKDHLLTCSIGFSIIYTITKNTFLFLPSHFPNDYYKTNAIRIAPNISFNLINVPKNISFYFDIGTLDNYLWYYIKSNCIDFTDIWSFAIGINIPLKTSE